MTETIFKQVNTQSPEYQQVWQLREDILRKPLGLSLKNEDLSADTEDIILVALQADEVVACLMLHPTADRQIIKLRQMAVAKQLQGRNLGRSLVQHAEKIAANLGYTKILLHARQSAIGFYSTLNYKITSDLFTEVGIQHVVMEKDI